MGARVDFQVEFEKRLAERAPNYTPRGIVTADHRLYPLGSDTKVLSSVFENFARPIVYDVAHDFGLAVREARAQNYYPDFTLMEDEDDPAKLAVDVKTTYRETDDGWAVTFTLGGYTSFIRNPTKNIEFPFGEYAEHWVIGYIYKRDGAFQPPPDEFYLDDIDAVPVPFTDVDVFVQEKWKIAGDRAGSGNTTNIGSIRGTLEDFREGRGVFRDKDEYLAYWRNYGRTAADRTGRYSNIEEFRRWRAELD